MLPKVQHSAVIVLNLRRQRKWTFLSNPALWEIWKACDLGGRRVDHTSSLKWPDDFSFISMKRWKWGKLLFDKPKPLVDCRAYGSLLLPQSLKYLVSPLWGFLYMFEFNFTYFPLEAKWLGLPDWTEGRPGDLLWFFKILSRLLLLHFNYQ
jgi:hypothetical protein